MNLGAVYESVIAQEFHAHGYVLHYYDNKQKIEDEADLVIPEIQMPSL